MGCLSCFWIGGILLSGKHQSLGSHAAVNAVGRT
jgi:hypothetical protein